MNNFLFYTAIFGIITLLLPSKAKVKLNRKKTVTCEFYLFVVLFFMCFMASFRGYDIGNDTPHYLLFFEQMHSGNYSYDSRVELLFRWFVIALTKLSSNYTLFLLSSSVIMFFSLYLFVKKCDLNVKLFCSMFWLFAFVAFVSPARQTLAISLVLLSLPYFESKKYIRFALLIIAASLFHTSSIIMLCIPLLYHIECTNRRIVFVVLGVFALVFSGALDLVSNLIGDYYSRYLSVQSGILAVVFNSMFALIPVILDVVFKVFEDFKNDKRYNFYRWCTVMYAGLYISSLYTSGASRIAYYFMPMTLVYWCKVLNNDKISKMNRIIIITMTIIILLVYKAMVLKYRPNWNSFFPFRFVWD